MKKLLLVIIITWSINLFAQENRIYETINYQKAIKEGTRSRDGNPGLNYWQNHADYDISVRLDTTEKKIFGKETVIYYNESPDTLKEIIIRLYPNKNKKGAVRDVAINEKDIHDGVQLDTIRITNSGILNNITQKFHIGTNMLIYLEQAIPPKSTVEIYCEWSYKLAKEPYSGRTGYYKDNAWFVGYFYPQIAVYDDIEQFQSLKGWDYTLFHKGIQEFYNDFNNYKVKIEVPESFFVWATGDLKNPNEVYSKSILRKLDKAKNTNEIVKIISKEDLNKELLIGKSWIFEASNVMDFAFGTALNYLWDGSSVQLNDKRVFVDVAYNPASEIYPKLIQVAKETVLFASNDFPGIEFPYNHATSFNGSHSGGMEFPMIANDADYSDSVKLYKIVSHELFHNYLPFMMGINEKRYPFIDEGFTVLFTFEFLWDYFELEPSYKFKRLLPFYSLFDDYNYYASNIDDNSVIYNSYAQTDLYNTKFQLYVKPTVAIKLFIDMVGENKFLFAFKEFVKRWQGKHPIPYDLFYTINDVLEENYNWYWQAWYFEIGYADLGIELADNIVSVQNIGGYPVPIELIVEYKDGTSTAISRSMSVWKHGDKQIKINLENFKKIKSVKINGDIIPDIDKSNNYIEL